jgi:hypothetical protein
LSDNGSVAITTTDLKSTIVLQQRNGVFCAVSAKMLYTRPVSADSQTVIQVTVAVDEDRNNSRTQRKRNVSHWDSLSVDW